MKWRFYKNLIDLNILISHLCYGPPDVGVRVLPVRFWYVAVCIIISFACLINSSASPVTDQCKNTNTKIRQL